MRSGKFLILFGASLFVAGVLTVCLSPFLITGGLHLWAARVGRQAGLQVELGRIEAPFLGPVVIHNLHITSDSAAPFRINAATPRLECDLNLAAVFTRSRGRVLRTLSADGITLDVRRNTPANPPSRPFAWQTLENLLADNFKLSVAALHVENGSTILDLNDGTLSGSQMETGALTADTLTISSPWFRKTFSRLRGATSWQNSRLTVGAVTVMRGIDLDSVSIDLAQIGQSRIGFEMSLDAFGGKIRASISSEDRDDRRTWDAVGSASEISLAQMSDALELTDRASGSLHACKFTFRGEVTDLRNATAAIWAEVTGLTWRDRTADTIMVGASLYNRAVQVEQLYLKQSKNQLTFSGEFTLPEQTADLLRTDLRGDISASINDLGDFARLFGASPSDFAGTIAINGNVDARERKLGGALALSGNALLLFRAPVESLKANLSFKESRLEIEEFELKHENDSFRGRASIDLAGERHYSGNFTTSLADVAEYAGLIPEPFASLELGGGLDLDWSGTGTASAHSGTFRAKGHGLHPRQFAVIPFDAEFEGDYAPDNIFFRQFRLSNPRADFSAFVTVAKDYFQLQTLRFDLNGKPKLQGNVFVPWSLSKILARENWLATWSDDPNFDVDVTIDSVDLAELAGAVTTRPTLGGLVAGKFELYGSPNSLESRSDLHLRDFVWENEPRLSVDLETRLALAKFTVKANAFARSSDPVKFEGTIPLQLEKRESVYAFKSEGPISATLNFPAVFLGKLPQYLSRGIFRDGILSGQLSVSDSLGHPRLLGDLQLIGGKFGVGSLLSTRITFGGQTGTIEFAQLRQGPAEFLGHGEADFRDLPEIALKFFPSAPLANSTSLEPGDCVSGLEFSSVPLGGRPFPLVRQIDFAGKLFTPPWTISLAQDRSDDPLAPQINSPRRFPFCQEDQSRGKTLTLATAPASLP